MISRVLLYLLMITCMLIRGSSKEVKWTMRDASPKLGQDLTLFCKVDNCTVNEIIKGWRGGPDDKVLMVNSGISTDKTKYSTSIDKHGFILTILNLTVKDLNVSYECSCGFDIDKHILYIEDPYKVDNLNKSTNGTNYVGIKDGDDIYLYIVILSILVIVPIIVIVVVQRHWLWRRLKGEVDNQNTTEPLSQTSYEDSNLRQSTDLDDNLHGSQSLQLLPESINRVTNSDTFNPSIFLYIHQRTNEDRQRSDRDNFEPSIFLPVHQPTNEDPQRSAEDDIYYNPRLRSGTVDVDYNLTKISEAESVEPSTSREASSEIVEVKPTALTPLPVLRTGNSITDTERSDSHHLPIKPHISVQYSVNHGDDTASTCPGKRHIDYANIKLRELSFQNWLLNKPTIEQLSEAGFFHSGDENIVQCFSCENKLYCNEGQDPLDGAFHNNCEYLREITSTQLQTACSPDQ